MPNGRRVGKPSEPPLPALPIPILPLVLSPKNAFWDGFRVEILCNDVLFKEEVELVGKEDVGERLWYALSYDVRQRLRVGEASCVGDEEGTAPLHDGWREDNRPKVLNSLVQKACIGLSVSWSIYSFGLLEIRISPFLGRVQYRLAEGHVVCVCVCVCFLPP